MTKSREIVSAYTPLSLVFASCTASPTRYQYQPPTLLRLSRKLPDRMVQPMRRRISVHSTKSEPQHSLKAEVAGDLRSFVANTLGNDESVNRMLGDAAFRSEVIDSVTTRAHGN